MGGRQRVTRGGECTRARHGVVLGSRRHAHNQQPARALRGPIHLDGEL